MLLTYVIVNRNISGSPNLEVPQKMDGLRETPIKVEDFGVPLFQDTTIYRWLTQ